VLKKSVAQYWLRIQRSLFPGFGEELGSKTDKHFEVMAVLDMIEIERFLPYEGRGRGRPRSDRSALLRSFVAKAVLNLPTTESLIDRLRVDQVLRRICGWESINKVPSSGTFSNAFAEFAETKITDRAHEFLIKSHYANQIVGHACRDSTAILGREKPLQKTKKPREKKKRGRRRKDAPALLVEPTRIEKQLSMTLMQMIKDLPTQADVGTKKNSKGYAETWRGFKLHVDVDDNGVPLSCILTSASTHDSQVAIPLELKTQQRVVSLYTLMDAAYNSKLIEDFVASIGKVAIIDPKAKCNGDYVPLDPAKKQRYKARTVVERFNSDVKDNYGANHVRVRGGAKVFSHLMFGTLAVAAMRIIELVN
jgi:Transposase DDE domain/Transposase domain (DUF772)